MGLAERPLALTLGDPAGIGPDITLLTWLAREHETIPPFVLLGDPSDRAFALSESERARLRIALAAPLETMCPILATR